MPALPASDLRSEAKAYRRDKTHTAKWARGGRNAPGRTCAHDQPGAGCTECVARPLLRDGARNYSNHFWHRAERAQAHASGHRQGSIAKKVLQNDLTEATINSDTDRSDEEVAALSEAPLPGAEILYSFDAHAGPNSGSDVLSNAVMQAVKRYENKETEKLVKAEYDLVDGKEAEDADDEEDDFEVISHDEHLH